MKPAMLFMLLFAFASCKKDKDVFTNESIQTNNQELEYTGSFISSAHPTSGTVSIYKDSLGTRQLVFENFKTDAGPDLRVYLSDKLGAGNWIELGVLKGTNGQFSYPLPTSAMPENQPNVLIWCEDFSVLFGYAPLMK